jgi:hypothetical protein
VLDEQLAALPAWAATVWAAVVVQRLGARHGCIIARAYDKVPWNFQHNARRPAPVIPGGASLACRLAATAARLAQPKGAGRDLAEEVVVGLGVGILSLVDDNLGGDERGETVAVENHVQGEVARVPVSTPPRSVRTTSPNPMKVHSSVCTPAGSPEMVATDIWLARWLMTVAPFTGFVKTKVPWWTMRESTGWLGAENSVTRIDKETSTAWPVSQ